MAKQYLRYAIIVLENLNAYAEGLLLKKNGIKFMKHSK